jgi:septal ring factor EnvC (AmiA/AmiB activator)
VLKHDDSTATLYAQCGEIYVTLGETVKEGQKIAEIGIDEDNDESYCHFAINAATVDPTNLITKKH